MFNMCVRCVSNMTASRWNCLCHTKLSRDWVIQVLQCSYFFCFQWNTIMNMDIVLILSPISILDENEFTFRYMDTNMILFNTNDWKHKRVQQSIIILSNSEVRDIHRFHSITLSIESQIVKLVTDTIQMFIVVKNTDSRSYFNCIICVHVHPFTISWLKH